MTSAIATISTVSARTLMARPQLAASAVSLEASAAPPLGEFSLTGSAVRHWLVHSVRIHFRSPHAPLSTALGICNEQNGH